VQGIVAQREGHIAVANDLGAGTIFTSGVVAWLDKPLSSAALAAAVVRG
jgi:hypothetical protein